ncbi:hypothetical protein E8E11_006146 [Didymella keratinophila]|nr:hypothetical protein E8E11_006146 [Didymella keratinophila]
MAGAIQALISRVSSTDVLSIRRFALFLGVFITIQIVRSVVRIVYNLYFHPLSKYPGPRLWAAFDVARTIGRTGGYIDFQIAEEHLKHGELTWLAGYHLTTFDLIADLRFGKPLDGLETGRSNAWIEKIDKMLRIMPVLMVVTSVPFLMTLFDTVLGRKMQQSRKEHQDYAASLAMSRIEGTEHADCGDFMDFILRSRGEDHKLTDEELVQNADLFMVAGSETTATVLLSVTSYLLQNPDAYQRATEEVRAAFVQATDINFRESAGYRRLFKLFR